MLKHAHRFPQETLFAQMISEEFLMHTPGFSRSRIDAMINLRDPLAVLSTRLPWAQIEALLSPRFEHRDRAGGILESSDLLGPVQAVVGAGQSPAGRPKLPFFALAAISLVSSTGHKSVIRHSCPHCQHMVCENEYWVRSRDTCQSVNPGTHRVL